MPAAVFAGTLTMVFSALFTHFLALGTLLGSENFVHPRTQLLTQRFALSLVLVEQILQPFLL